ncbi:MAG: DUF2213 domain-containing protein [Bacteroidales bacterium]|nr:DUF2213 domain-containing protein [Bacteroidales bacterium]
MTESQNYISLVSNLVGLVRNETLEGRPYLAVPMVMIKEGVLNGSDGPILYTSEELAKVPQVWNTKPVVVQHPTLNGKSLSACDPDVLEKYRVGMIMNTSWDGQRLKAEAWLEPSRLEAVDSRVLNAVQKGEMMEVSTGLFSEIEPKPGVFKGRHYKGVVRNLRPDHLAILPDSIGACSIADGAGLMRNSRKEMELILNSFGINRDAAHDKVRLLLRNAASAELGERFDFVENVFDTTFVYKTNEGLWQRNYSLQGGKAVLEGFPIRVEKKVTYVALANEEQGKSKMKNEIKNNKAIVEELSSHGVRTEEDREFLEGLSEGQLTKNMQTAKTAVVTPSIPPTEEKKEEIVGEVKQVDNTEQVKAPSDYLEALPAEIREVLNEALSTQAEQKTKLVETIVANKKNILSKEQLATLKMTELKAMAALAQEEPKAKTSYAGLGPVGNVQNEVVEEPLLAPTMNFERK